MKVLILCLSVLVSFATPLQRQNDGIEINYDKFRDNTRALIKDGKAINVKGATAVYLTLFYDYDGKTASKFIEPEVNIVIVPKFPIDADELELRLLIDGEINGPYYCKN